MKALVTETTKLDSARVAVLFGLTIGLGIAIHPVFLLVAAVIGIAALIAVVSHAIHQHGDHKWLTHGMN